jgi:photosystem II stability/assembly factor-like uncharacterized protein
MDKNPANMYSLCSIPRPRKTRENAMNRSYKTLLLWAAIVLYFPPALVGQIQFWEQKAVPYEGNITSIEVDSSYRIFITVIGKGVFASHDQGLTWVLLNNGLPRDDNIRLYLNSKGHLFCATESGLYRSLNQGQDWQQLGLKELKGSIAAAGIGVADKMLAAVDNTIYLSPDNGDTWQNVTANFANRGVYRLAFNNKGDFFISTHTSGLYRSIDAGSSWQAINTGLSNLYVAPLAHNSKDELFVGTLGSGVFRSTDNGDHWSEINSDNIRPMLISQLLIDSHDYVYAATNGGVFVTKNNGLSWAMINSGLKSNSVNALAIDRQGFLYAGTNGGGVYRSAKSTQTRVAHSSIDQSPRQCELVGNYPNPFNLSTCIRYALQEPCMMDINILTLNGRQVANLRSGFCEAGTHEIRWDATDVSSGIYLCRLITGRENSAIKLLLVK